MSPRVSWFSTCLHGSCPNYGDRREMTGVVAWTCNSILERWRDGVKRARRSKPAGAMNRAFMGVDGKNCLVLPVLRCCHGARTGGIAGRFPAFFISFYFVFNFAMT